MPKFTGTLNANEIFASIYNMIISQQVFANPIKGTNAQLVDKARVDGTLYGDTKLYYSTDVLKSAPWGNDAEATNLLALHRPADPECQAIELNVFRQISLTTDNYLSKRAWGTEGAFSSFNSVMKGWISNTKKVYDSTLYNSYIGTAETNIGLQEREVTLPTVADDLEAQNRLQAQTIAEDLANLMVDLTDLSRDYNDYGFLRSYGKDDFMIVFNAKVWNKITKLDLPTIFHKDGLIDMKNIETLPARYFGTINTVGGTTPAANTTIRSLVEKDFGSKHCFPGDLLPNNQAYGANETYTVDDTILYKVITKGAIPYMSAFSVQTSFFNAKSLTENQYLTFGHNTLEYLKEFPLITVRKA